MLQCDNIHPRILDRMCTAFSDVAAKEGGGVALLRYRNLWGTEVMKYLNQKDIDSRKEAVNER